MNSCQKSRVMAEARGYVGQMEYLERMSKTNTQHKCPKCGLLHIWKRKLQTLIEETPSE
jgi:hypothetical protein